MPAPRRPHARRSPVLLSAVFVAAWSAVVAGPALAAGSVSLTALDTAYIETFDGLALSGTASTVPTGWDFSESGTNANTTYTAGTGSGTAGDTYSFGAASSEDRALGGLRSGTLVPLIGVQLTNDTGATIDSLDISYIGEQWRLGQNTAGRAADRLDVQLSTDATSLTSPRTWVDQNGLDFASPVVAGTVGALNGNVSPNRTSRSLTITGLSIADGATFWLRWTDMDLIPGADDGLAIDDFSITPHGAVVADDPPAVASTVPADGATDFPIGANLSVTFSEPVTVTDPWFSLECSVTGPVAASVGGGPTTWTLDPAVTLTDGETCTLTIDKDAVHDQDGNDPPDTMVASFVVGFSANDACLDAYTAAYDIQGSGSAAAITGTVTTQGVVVGDFEGTAANSGFFLQDLTGDGDPATSDGIFVFTGSSNLVSAGQVVRVTGFAHERFDQTTLNGSSSNTAAVPAANIIGCGTGSVAATDVTLPFDSLGYPERYEGMLVRFPQSLVIAEYFNFDRFGEIVLAQPLDGEPRPFSGTAIDAPGAAANARTAANARSRITLDDAQSAQNPPVLRHPNGNPFTLANRFRGGDLVANATGVIGFDFSLYRIYPTTGADYTAANPRTTAPEPVGGTVRAAAMNTLNYFLTLDTTTNDTGPGPCGGNANLDCRGADADQPAEFTRQRDKLLQALAGLDADVLGLNELENTPEVEPLADIVSGLPGYDYIDTGTIGTDAIKVGLIYRPAVVTPVGPYALLTSAVDPRFIDTKSRPSLAQTFEVNATGARFTVVVNHLKSKGSACDDVGDPDLGDGQGNCSQTRLAAARALVDWIESDPTGSGDRDVLIMGDLNSYAREQSISAIKAGPDDTVGTADDYTNLIATFGGPYAYSYTFDGQAGYLDHALSTATMLGQTTAAEDWHINSDEPDILDYDTSFKPPAQDALYEPNAYRTSDHDPVIVGLDPIAYEFSGFLSPVDNAPAVNSMKAGAAIPVRFSLGGDFGLDVLAAGSPTSQSISCDGSAPVDPVEQTVSAGSSGLGYDPASDTYTYVWKTNKAWAGTCRELVLTFDDGTFRSLLFTFTK